MFSHGWSFTPQKKGETVAIMTVSTKVADRRSSSRLHKPGVAGSSPAAATSVSVCHTPADDYHRWPEVSCSQLKELRSSPLAFYLRHVAKTAPPKSGDALQYGSLLHLWAELTDSEFWKRAVQAPESVCTATGAIGAKGKEWAKTLSEDAIPVSNADYERLRHQTQQILLNRAARRLLENSIDREFNIKWKWHGHAVRCRVDGATRECFYDLKTTREANPLRTFHRAVMDFGYHLQAAMYGSAGEAAGWGPHRMQFICTSNVWPYECQVVVLPHDVMEQGRQECLRLLEELQHRLEWDVWSPITYGEVHELHFPSWSRKKGDRA